MHTAGTTNTAVDDMSRLYVSPTCKVIEKILKGLDENDCIQCKYRDLSRVLSQLLQDNADLCISAE